MGGEGEGGEEGKRKPRGVFQKRKRERGGRLGRVMEVKREDKGRRMGEIRKEKKIFSKIRKQNEKVKFNNKNNVIANFGVYNHLRYEPFGLLIVQK